MNNEEVQIKQLDALEQIANYFSKEEQAKRERRAQNIAAKIAGASAVLAGSTVGIWEISLYLHERWEIREMAAEYAQIAENIYYEENNPEVALTFLDKAVDLRGNNANYRFLKAYIEGMAAVRLLLNLDRPYNKQEIDQVHEAMASALLMRSLEPKRPESYILQAQLFTALKEIDRAIPELNKALELDPNNAFAYVRLAMIHASPEKKEWNKALELLDKAISLDKDSKWGYLWKGVVYGYQAQWEPARKFYNIALEKDPRFDLGYYNLAWTYLKEKPKNYELAKINFEKTLKIKPDYKEALYGLAMTYGYQDRYEIAESYLDQAIKIDDQFLTAYKWRAIVKEEQKHYQAAAEDFAYAIGIDPTNSDLYIRRSRLMQKMDNIEQALLDLNFAQEVDPENYRIGLYSGRIYLKQEQYENAVKYYSSAINIKKDYGEAYTERAQAYIKMEALEKAQADLDKAVEVTSYRPERVLMVRAMFLESQEDLEGALADYQMARNKAKSNQQAPIWLAEAKLLQKMERYQEALTAINAYLELKPQDKNAQNLKQELIDLDRATSATEKPIKE